MIKTKKLTGLLLWAYAGLGYAQSLGQVSENILQPAIGLSHVMRAVCYIIGIGLVMGAFLQYKQHRQSPTQVRISTPILLLLLGVALILLPWISQYSHGAGIVYQGKGA